MKTGKRRRPTVSIFAAITFFAVFTLLIRPVRCMDNIPAYYGHWSNGIPADPNFFPIAVWLQDPSTAAAYKNAGVTLFIGLWNGPVASDLSTLASAGMPVLCDQNAVGLANLSNKTIMGWTQMDEPDNAQPDGSGGYLPCVDPSVIVQNYNTWVANDPSRPVFLNFGQGASNTGYYGRGTCTGNTGMYAQYSLGADIISFDIYPVNDNYPLYYVPQGIDNLRNWTGDAKPVWCWIETTLISSDSTAKPATGQVRSEVWMALIHGAAGFGYFCHSFYPSEDDKALLDDPVMLAAVTAINQQVISLAPVLNSNTVKNFAADSSGNTTVPIDIMVKQYGGSTYVFAAAMRNNPTTGTFTVPLPDISVDVMGESRQVQLAGGSFSDSFQPYDVHIYKIGSTGPTPTITATCGICLTASPTYTPTCVCTPPVTPMPEILAINGAMTFPNPYESGNPVYLRFNASRSGAAMKLKLYTAAFRLIKSADLGDCMPGTVTKQLDENMFKSLAEGMYYYVITGKGGQAGEARSTAQELIMIK